MANLRFVLVVPLCNFLFGPVLAEKLGPPLSPGVAQTQPPGHQGYLGVTGKPASSALDKRYPYTPPPVSIKPQDPYTSRPPLGRQDYARRVSPPAAPSSAQHQPYFRSPERPFSGIRESYSPPPLFPPSYSGPEPNHLLHRYQPVSPAGQQKNYHPPPLPPEIREAPALHAPPSYYYPLRFQASEPHSQYFLPPPIQQYVIPYGPQPVTQHYTPQLSPPFSDDYYHTYRRPHEMHIPPTVPGYNSGMYMPMYYDGHSSSYYDSGSGRACACACASMRSAEGQ